jgi:VPDSG-CTERM motif
MKTKTILAMLAIGFISCALFSEQAQATPITGNITFFGTVSLDGNANTATMVTAYHGLGGAGSPFVASADGSFTGLDGFAATFTAPWSFNSGAVANFWSVGGFVFNLFSSSITVQAGGSLIVDGTGTITGNGLDATAGSWHFTTQNPSARGVFSFSAATGAVPDGGSAVALLGIAFLGLEGLRRKLHSSRLDFRDKEKTR